MSGSHYAPEPPASLVLRWDDVRPLSLAEWMQRVDERLAALEEKGLLNRAELRVSELPLPPQQGKPTPLDEATLYDLRTVTERDADRLAQLELRIDNLLDVAERQAQRLRRLEVENVALREAVALHADLLQHYRLTAGI